MTTPQLTRLAGTLALVAAALATAPAPASAYGSLVIFGDSISDSGNVALASMTPQGPQYSPLPDGNGFVPSLAYAPQSPGYALGTFSNGVVWTTQLAAMLHLSAVPALLPNAGGTNFAFGGARVAGADLPVPTLSTQVGMFLGATNGFAPSDALYIVEGGANDARDAALAVAAGADLFTTAGATGRAYAQAIGGIVDTLQAAGANHILVFNTPNIGVTPAARQTLQGAYVSGVVSAVMNGYLADELAGEPGVMMFDSYSFLTGVALNPASVGLSNSSAACGFAGNGVACSSAVFWDGIHPTTAMHGAIAGAVYAQLVPEPATYGLMALGLLVVGAAARRRSARG